MSTPIQLPSAAAPDAIQEVNEGDEVIFALTGAWLTAGRDYTATFKPTLTGETVAITPNVSALPGRITITIPAARSGRLRVRATTASSQRTFYILDVVAV